MRNRAPKLRGKKSAHVVNASPRTGVFCTLQRGGSPERLTHWPPKAGQSPQPLSTPLPPCTVASSCLDSKQLPSAFAKLPGSLPSVEVTSSWGSGLLLSRTPQSLDCPHCPGLLVLGACLSTQIPCVLHGPQTPDNPHSPGNPSWLCLRGLAVCSCVLAPGPSPRSCTSVPTVSHSLGPEPHRRAYMAVLHPLCFGKQCFT